MRESDNREYRNDDELFDSKWDSGSDSDLNLDSDADYETDERMQATTDEIVYTEKPKSNRGSNIMVMIAMCVFMAIGVFMLYMGVSSVIRQMSYEKVDAEVISVRTYISRDSDGDSTLMAVPTYAYYVDGVRYEVESDSASSANIAPIVGDIVTIRYNPANPAEIVSAGWICIVYFVFGLVFGGVGLTVFICTLTGKMQWEPSRGRHRHRF